MKILVIDIGIKNVGTCLIKYSNNDLILYGKKFDWSKWNANNNIYLSELIKFYNLNKMIPILIERQFIGKTYGIMNYVYGYFSALDYNVTLVSPISYGKKITTRKNRKNYSIDLLKEYNINLSYEYHDIADSINLGIKYMINNKSINFKDRSLQERSPREIKYYFEL